MSSIEEKPRNSRYEELLSLPHPVSKKHPPMSRADRAAQFAPFAALVGYDAAIHESARLTEPRRLLTEAQVAILNDQLRDISAHLADRPQISLTYFQPDDRKTGGSYQKATGIVRSVNITEQIIRFEEGPSIPFSDIWEIEQPPQ